MFYYQLSSLNLQALEQSKGRSFVRERFSDDIFRSQTQTFYG